MQYREYQPIAGLRRQVRCLWTLSGQPSATDAIEDIVPDGCAELIINRGDRFEQSLANGESETHGDMLIAGQISKLLQIRPTGRIDLIGIRFQPGGLFPFLQGRAISEFSDRRIDVQDFDSALAGKLAAAANTGMDRLPAIQRILFQGLQVVGPERSLAEEAAQRIESTGGRTEIHGLSRALAVSERSLQRAFRREVGISPKLFARIIRCQSFLAAAESKTPWSLLALDCGYFDQPHVHRDCRLFTGKSPGVFLGEDHKLHNYFSGKAEG